MSCLTRVRGWTSNLVINKIREYKSIDWNIKFTHTLGEGNNGANALAKMGSSSSSPMILWDNCPPQLHSHLLADALGVFFLRL